MRPDAYTKSVITVIAGCLLWLCAMNTGRPLSAQQPMPLAGTTVQPVVVVGWGTMDEKGQVSVVMTDTASGRRSEPGVPVKLAGNVRAPLDVRVVGLPTPVDVRLPYTDQAPIPVGITRIKPTGEWEPIRNAAEPEPTRPRPGGR